jgi:hypothetical protein
MLCLKSESPRRPIGQRTVALIVIGSFVSACAPMPPPPPPLGYYGPARMPPPVTYQATATPPATYVPPVAVQSAPPPAPQQPARSNLADDALFGAAGYVVGRNAAVPSTAATVTGTTVETTVARTLTVTGETATVTDIASAAVTDGAIAEGAEVGAGALLGDFLLPVIVIGGALYLGYRAVTDSPKTDSSK